LILIAAGRVGVRATATAATAIAVITAYLATAAVSRFLAARTPNPEIAPGAGRPSGSLPAAAGRRTPPETMAEDSTATATYDLDGYELSVVTGAGPRLIGFRRSGGAQLFASLGDLKLKHPGLPDYALLGGHRLWRAPEVPAVTYEPDDRPVSIELQTAEDGASAEVTLVVEGAPESDGLVKRLTVSSHGGYIIVDHELRNDSWKPIEGAPWAITQMVSGGMAVLPQNDRLVDPEGVQPNRAVVLWPYTDPGAPEIAWDREAILITGSSDPAPLKVGQRNDRGWLAYAAAGELFVKWTRRHDSSRRYLDLDATMQVYRNDRFVELETMGSPQVIAPGHAAKHRETWAIYQIGDVDAAALPAAIQSLDLPGTPAMA